MSRLQTKINQSQDDRARSDKRVVRQKIYSIADHEGVPKGQKENGINCTIYFDSHLTAGVDCHCGNKDSSEEDGEEGEKDSV